jgi:endonuclease/exonuclease/phosphatase family metal-dependent hydrolase
MPRKQYKRAVVALGLISMLTIAAFSPSPAFAAETDTLRVMTYNLRYASDSPPNSWGERLPVAVAMLGETAPDVIGTQEGLYRQVKDLDAALADYDWIGVGRNGGSRSEFMAVFFRRERLEPLEFDHFWLSDTPDVVGSTTWGNSNIRMVTWVRFRDRQTDREFYALNTHFDHETPKARQKSAELIVQRVAKLDQSLPVILLGDFNARADNSAVYDTLVADTAFSDTWHTADQHGDAIDTFHSYRTVGNNGRRIDWILSRGPVHALSTEVVTFSRDGQYPSDHFPVMADVVVAAAPGE